MLIFACMYKLSFFKFELTHKEGTYYVLGYRNTHNNKITGIRIFPRESTYYLELKSTYSESYQEINVNQIPKEVFELHEDKLLFSNHTKTYRN